MSDPIWLSVITPLYNGARFLPACLRNVSLQQCDGVEHIVVDGGSTDGSKELLERFTATNPALRWISCEGAGQSEAINQGIALARGHVVGILNVDDDYTPGALAEVFEAFAAVPEPALVVGNCRVVGESGELLWVNSPKRISRISMLIRRPGTPNIPINPSAYFYHRSLHSRIGLYDESEHFVMDIDFLLRAAQIARVVYVNKTWGTFWLHSQTKTAQDRAQGTDTERLNALVKKYHRQLPRRDRIVIDSASLAYSPWRLADILKRRLARIAPANILRRSR